MSLCFAGSRSPGPGAYDVRRSFDSSCRMRSSSLGSSSPTWVFGKSARVAPGALHSASDYLIYEDWGRTPSRQRSRESLRKGVRFSPAPRSTSAPGTRTSTPERLPHRAYHWSPEGSRRPAVSKGNQDQAARRHEDQLENAWCLIEELLRHRALAEERMQQAQEAALASVQDHCKELLQYRNRTEEQLNREERMPSSCFPEMLQSRPEMAQRRSEELAFELSFDGRSSYIDAKDFETQLRNGLWRVGAEESDVQHLSISLRPVTFSGLCKPGNVIARISGPTQTVRSVWGLPLQRVRAVGCRAMVFRLVGEVAHQRHEAVAASMVNIFSKSCTCEHRQSQERRLRVLDSPSHVQHAQNGVTGKSGSNTGMDTLPKKCSSENPQRREQRPEHQDYLFREGTHTAQRQEQRPLSQGSSSDGEHAQDSDVSKSCSDTGIDVCDEA